MKFWNGFILFWIIFFLFFSIGLPLILHYGGGLHLSDYEMIHTSSSKAFILLGLGTALWFIVFIYYIKQFLINPLLKKNAIIYGHVLKWNAKTIVFTVIGLLLLIALAAGILVYSYKNESRGYSWRYLYFWHPYIMIPGSFIFYSGILFDITKGFFRKIGTRA